MDMTTIKIPLGMADEDIAAYVKRQINQPTRIAVEEKKQLPAIPKQSIEIPGDDWTTNSKGMSGKASRRIAKMYPDATFKKN